MTQTPSDKLDALADVAAAIEAAGNEIADLCVTVDDDTACGTICVTVPVVEASTASSCDFDLAAATLTDGTLQVDLDVATETPEPTANDEHDAPDAAPTADRDETDAADERDAGQTVAAADPSTSASEESSAETESAQSMDANPSESTPGREADADTNSPTADDTPAYRDPDRLAAVYDPEATFAEMTDALGVDVTPQTVRKYMIEHGIHEPQSRASDTLANVNSDATTMGSDEPAPERATSETEADTDGSQPSSNPPDAPEISTNASQPDEDTQASSTDANRDRDGESTGEAATDAHTTAQANTGSEPASKTVSEPTNSTETDNPEDTATPATQPTTEDDTEQTSDNTATSPDEAADADSGAPTTTATDGGTQPTLSAVEPLELPDEVSVSELVTALTNSRTVYEVRRGLGIDDAEARSLLRQYDLIDLVTGRITHGAEPPDKQEVLARLIDASDRAA